MHFQFSSNASCFFIRHSFTSTLLSVEGEMKCAALVASFHGSFGPDLENECQITDCQGNHLFKLRRI
jgi:hypothetical protein